MTEKEFYQLIGQRIRELREKKGLKQKEIAEASGMNASFLSKVENAGKKISAFQINRILEAMGYSQGDLFEDAEKKKLTLTLNGDEISQLSNGEKMAFAEKVKLFFKVAFSEQMLREMAQELEQETLEREAAAQAEREAKQRQKKNGLSDLLNHGLCF